jgi:hypothetical protein
VALVEGHRLPEGLARPVQVDLQQRVGDLVVELLIMGVAGADVGVAGLRVHRSGAPDRGTGVAGLVVRVRDVVVRVEQLALTLSTIT